MDKLPVTHSAAPRKIACSVIYEAILERCGLATAEALLTGYGGTRIYIPHVWHDRHWLNRIGQDHAKLLILHFAGESFAVPRNTVAGKERTRMIRQLAEQGLGRNEIALKAHVSRRWVEMVLADEPVKNTNQTSLF